MNIKDGIVIELKVGCSFTVRTDSFSDDVTSISCIVDYADAPEHIVQTMLKKSTTIEMQKKRKLGAAKVYEMFHGKTVPYTTALAGVKLGSIVSPEEAKAVTIRTYKGLVADGKFAEAEDMLFEITGEHSQAYKDAHPPEDKFNTVHEIGVDPDKDEDA